MQTETTKTATEVAKKIISSKFFWFAAFGLLMLFAGKKILQKIGIISQDVKKETVEYEFSNSQAQSLAKWYQDAGRNLLRNLSEVISKGLFNYDDKEEVFAKMLALSELQLKFLYKRWEVEAYQSEHSGLNMALAIYEEDSFWNSYAFSTGTNLEKLINRLKSYKML
jgi:hypothetical protein